MVNDDINNVSQPTENTDVVQSVKPDKYWQFQKGQSGNPAGKPKGATHNATRAALALMDGQLEQLTQKCIERALKGDTTAMRLVMERVVPPRKDIALNVETPKFDSLEGIAAASVKIVEGATAGVLTPSEAKSLLDLLDSVRKNFESKVVSAIRAQTEEYTLQGSDQEILEQYKQSIIESVKINDKPD
jgi:hypothetical protein